MTEGGTGPQWGAVITPDGPATEDVGALAARGAPTATRGAGGPKAARGAGGPAAARGAGPAAGTKRTDWTAKRPEEVEREGVEAEGARVDTG